MVRVARGMSGDVEGMLISIVAENDADFRTISFTILFAMSKNSVKKFCGKGQRRCVIRVACSEVLYSLLYLHFIANLLIARQAHR